MMRHALFAFGLLLFAQGVAHEEASVYQTPPHSHEVLFYAEQNLPLQGVLKQNPDGFVYVDVDDDYIHLLSQLIREEGFEEPPYFEPADAVGAHISVVYSEEAQEYSLKDLAECGRQISFTLRGCHIVKPRKFSGVSEVYVIEVEAPELQQIRKHYGLPKREYPLHITVGVKSKL